MVRITMARLNRRVPVPQKPPKIEIAKTIYNRRSETINQKEEVMKNTHGQPDLCPKCKQNSTFCHCRENRPPNVSLFDINAHARTLTKTHERVTGIWVVKGNSPLPEKFQLTIKADQGFWDAIRELEKEFTVTDSGFKIKNIGYVNDVPKFIKMRRDRAIAKINKLQAEVTELDNFLTSNGFKTNG